MSGKVVGMVFDHYPGKGAELLLAVKLADNAHHDGTSIYPSVETLADQTRQSQRSVQYQLKRMVAMGWLVLVRHAVGGGRGGGFGRPREYRIHPDFINAYDSLVPADRRPVWVAKVIAAETPEKEMGATSAPISFGPKEEAGQETGAAAIAPVLKKWVQPSAEMGATAVAEMGAIAVAPEPSLTVNEPKTPLTPEGVERGFAKFWSAYPKKAGEANARRQWLKLRPDAAQVKLILGAVQAQAATEGWTRESGRYVPKASAWLSGKCWADEVAAGVSAAALDPDSRQSVEQLAVGLGIGKWDCLQELWVAYRARVRAAAAGAHQRAA